MILQLDQKSNCYLSQYSHHLFNNKLDSQLERRKKLGIWSDLDMLDNLIVKSKRVNQLKYFINSNLKNIFYLDGKFQLIDC